MQFIKNEIRIIYNIISLYKSKSWVKIREGIIQQSDK